MSKHDDDSMVCDAPYCRSELPPGSAIQYVKDEELHRVCVKHWQVISETILWILLIVPWCLLSGCSFLVPEKGKSVVGNSLSQCIENEGGTHWMQVRDESCADDVVILEWNYGTSTPFCQIAFDRKEWLARERSEPKALWVVYDWHGGCLGEPHP